MDVLTKSDFLLFLEAETHLWAKANGKLVRVPSEADRFLMQQGYEVEKLAFKWLSIKLSKDGSKVVGQKTVERDGLKARADVWVEKFMSNEVQIYEIKSGTKAAKKHVYDLTFQSLAYSQYSPTRLFLVHPNPKYEKKGELELDDFFIIDEVSEEVKKLQDEVKRLTKRAQEVTTLKTYRGLAGCTNCKTCPCPSICFGNLSDTSVFFFRGMRGDKSEELVSRGEKTMQKVNTTEDLSSFQKTQVEVAKSGKPVIEKEKIAKWVKKLVFPLYFLDYESINLAIPRFDGHRPHDHLPFQYSLHIVPRSGNDEVLHNEFLATKQADPVEELLESLKQQIGTKGSVLVWYQHFEKGRNQFMARMVPKYADFLLQLNERIADLMDPFFKGWYVDSRFRGSTSIKEVIPVLAPELSYKTLAVGDGGMALASWYKMVFGGVSEEEQKYLARSLIEYCKLDTWAMVKIWQKLVEITDHKSDSQNTEIEPRKETIVSKTGDLN